MSHTNDTESRFLMFSFESEFSHESFLERIELLDSYD